MIKLLFSKATALPRILFYKIMQRLAYLMLEHLNRTPYIYGEKDMVHFGSNVSPVNTFFNTGSGHIYIGDNTIFGHNCMVITGRHEYADGQRKDLLTKVRSSDIPPSGYDIYIGSGCWIASGSIISGGVRIGDNTIIGAGAVVVCDIPSGVMAAGVPARVIKDLRNKLS